MNGAAVARSGSNGRSGPQLVRSPELKRPVRPPVHRPLAVSSQACGAAPQLHHDHSVARAGSSGHRPSGGTCGWSSLVRSVEAQARGQANPGARLSRGAAGRATEASSPRASLPPVRALIVHARDESAGTFYARHGFEPSPTDPLHRVLLMKDLRASLVD